MTTLPGLPKPLECLLRGLLEENHLSSWTSDWVDGEVKLTIRFSPSHKNSMSGGPGQAEAIGGRNLGSAFQDSDSDSDTDTLKGIKASLDVVNTNIITEEGTADKPRRYHLLELANSPQEPLQSPVQGNNFSTDPCTNQSMSMMSEEKGLSRRGMTPSTSSSSEDNIGEKELGQKVRTYRTINLREFGNTYCSSSAENSSPDGYDEVDNNPLKVYNQMNASDTADKFDATRLVDITE